ncbi:hypothetical protein [Microbacterium jejuense]|uniref:hypothetical protein n=1 Tax=Microbacterium jejuense TaxID=1263637 RepID=UPI0031F017FF
MDHSPLSAGVTDAWLETLANLVAVRSPLAGALYQRLIVRDEWSADQRAALVRLAPWVGANATPKPAPAVAPGEIAMGVMGYHTADPSATSRNIGDWVQTVSMSSHLIRRADVQFTGDPELVKVFEQLRQSVPAENVIHGPSARVSLIEFNRDSTLYDAIPQDMWAFVFGWYMKRIYGGREQFPLNPNIRPLFISFHISSGRTLTPAAVEYLKANGPIGCRDWHTVRLLLAKGVPAYFSGCVTTTIGGLFPRAQIDASKPAAFVDVGPEHVEPGAVRLKNLDDGLRERPLAASLQQAVRRIDAYRNDYSRVVTSRLHTFLPAESCGVAVEWRPHKADDRRFDGLIGPTEAPRELMRARITQIVGALLDSILRGDSTEEVRQAYWAEVAPDLAASKATIEDPSKSYDYVGITKVHAS